VLPRGYVFMSGGVNFFDKGIWVMDPGTRWDAHGAPVTRTWSKLDADSAAGAATVTVKDNVTDWFIGGDVVVTQTSNPLREGGGCHYKTSTSCAYFFENEARKIVSVQALPGNRTQITLDKPLTYAHQGTGKTRGEVGLLTRNILVRTEVTGVLDATLDTDVRERTFSHTMFVGGGKGDIQYTEFKYMGNLAQLARYPIHFHKVGFAGDGTVIRGNSIWRSGNRGYQPHDGRGILFEDNVAFDTVMSPFYVERTNGVDRTDPKIAPHDIWFVHNLGVQSTPAPTTGTAQQNDAAIFWFENLEQVMLGNVAVGAGAYSGSSGEVPVGGLPPAGGGDEAMGFFPSIRSDQTGLLRPPTYRKNEFHSNGLNGMRFWNRNGIQPYDFVDVSTWRNGHDGISWGYYRSPHRVYQLEAIENKIGIGSSRIVGTGSRFVQDATITGNEVGIIQPYQISTSIYPDSPWIYTRVYLDNTDADISRGARICTNPEDVLWTIASRVCHPGYTLMIDPVFNSSTPIGLGTGQDKAAEANGGNTNTMWRIKGATGLAPGYPNDFLLMRPDQINPANQTAFTSSFLTGNKELISNPEALRVDVSTLPGTIVNDIFGKNDGSFRTDIPFLTHQYTWEKDVDVPPKVSMSMSLSGKVATVSATATDDKRVNRVEFWVDDKAVATDTTVPYTASIDLSNHPTRYAYVYAVAYDDYIILRHWNDKIAAASPGILGSDYDQRAYSKVAVVGPEVLDTGQVLPPLPPPPSLFKKDPIGWWKFDEGVGTVAADSSVEKRDGTFVDNPAWTSGKLGGALLFDGVDDYVELNYGYIDELEVPQGVTVSGWVTFRPGATGTWIRKPSTTSLRIGLSSSQPGKTWASLPIDGARTRITGKTTLPPDTWHHVALTYDGSDMRLYVNGKEDGVVNKSGRFVVGAGGGGSNFRIGYGFWDGAVDDVRIYNRALPASEITGIFLGGSSTNPAITRLGKRHLFLDKIQTITITGVNFSPADDFRFRMKNKTGTVKIDELVRPTNSTTIVVDLVAMGVPVSGLDPGFYAIEIERVSDKVTASTSATFVVTRLGDIWSSTATSTSLEPRDARINIHDVSRMLSKFGSTDFTDLTEADINAGPGGVSSGKIDIFDANKLMANWTG
jgi:hypothetical protein